MHSSNNDHFNLKRLSFVINIFGELFYTNDKVQKSSLHVNQPFLT